MTAVRKFEITENTAENAAENVDASNIHGGNATALFTSGSAPFASGDALLGDADDAFTSGSAPLADTTA